jgi:hypothetical protein
MKIRNPQMAEWANVLLSTKRNHESLSSGSEENS